MGVVLQLLSSILSPLFLAMRSLLSSCEAGKLRKSLKELREKYILNILAVILYSNVKLTVPI